MTNSFSEQSSISSLTANIDSLSASIIQKNPLHQNFMTATLANVTTEELRHLNQYIDFCKLQGLSIDYLSDCYLKISGDALREQIYFRKHKKYRYSTFAEVESSVYCNDDYMSSYMHGLALTTFLWPNHLALLRFFNTTLPESRTGAYLEIGPGHGYFLMSAMDNSSYQTFTGIDISKTSIDQTGSVIEYFRRGHEKAYELHCMDFLECDLPIQSFDAIVMGEVLEHVERPDLLLKQIVKIAKQDAFIFVSTCINAPAIDHIHLFSHPEELQSLFDDCGLRITNQIIKPYDGKTLEESLRQLYAINVAYILEKK